MSAKTLRPILESYIKADATVYSDDGGSRVTREFPGHASVNHSIGEYVRGPVHTNTIESYFATLKRSIFGTYHHVGQKHLKRYLGEVDFRYNERMALGVSDVERTAKAVLGTVGKRRDLSRNWSRRSLRGRGGYGPADFGAAPAFF